MALIMPNQPAAAEPTPANTPLPSPPPRPAQAGPSSSSQFPHRKDERYPTEGIPRRARRNQSNGGQSAPSAPEESSVAASASSSGAATPASGSPSSAPTPGQPGFIGPVPNTGSVAAESYGGRVVAYLDEGGQPVNTRQAARYYIANTGEGSRVRDVRADWSSRQWQQAGYTYNPRSPNRNLGEHHGKHPADLLGPSAETRQLQRAVRDTYAGHRVDVFGNVAIGKQGDAYENSAVPASAVTGVDADTGRLTFAEGTRVRGLNPEHRTIGAVNDRGELQYSATSAGARAAQVGGFLPGFETAHGLGLATDPESPGGRGLTQEERAGIGQSAALDAFYLTGTGYAAGTVAKTGVKAAASGAGKQFFSQPARNIIKPLFVEPNILSSSREVGRQVAGAARGGKRLATGETQITREGVRQFGRDVRGGLGNEIKEGALEATVETGVTGDLPSAVVEGANVVGFGALEGAGSAGRRRLAAPTGGGEDPALLLNPAGSAEPTGAASASASPAATAPAQSNTITLYHGTSTDFQGSPAPMTDVYGLRGVYMTDSRSDAETFGEGNTEGAMDGELRVYKAQVDLRSVDDLSAKMDSGEIDYDDIIPAAEASRADVVILPICPAFRTGSFWSRIRARSPGAKR